MKIGEAIVAVFAMMLIVIVHPLGWVGLLIIAAIFGAFN